MIKKVGCLTILLLTKLAVAQSFYTTCSPPPSSPTVSEINNYNSCIANNRASAQSSGTAAAMSFTISGSTVVQPLSGSSVQNDILNKNISLNTSTPSVALTTEQIAATSITTKGAIGSLAQSMKANTEGETSYLVTAESTLAAGLSSLSMAGACASVSSTPCYNQKDDMYATGAAYLLVQRQAEDQVGQHQRARAIACDAINQLSTNQMNCGNAFDSALTFFSGNVMTSASGITVTVIPSVTSSPVSAISYDALTGACTPANAPECLNLSRNVSIPSSRLQQEIREILKQKYAGTKSNTIKAQNLYSKNSDGTISVKGGSTYSNSDFSDPSKFKIKGLKIQPWLTATTNSIDITTTSSKSSSSSVEMTEEKLPSSNLDNLDTKDLLTTEEQTIDIEREPASLKKKVGSEFIGVAKDNIFKIINRRYKHEEKEDYFY